MRAFAGRAQSVLRPPGDPAALEARLGVRLPPSYRAFLERSDGAHAQPWAGVTDGLGFLDCASVGWLRDADPETIDIWTDESEAPGDVHPAFAVEVPEAEYLDANTPPDVLKRGHLRYALRISAEHDTLMHLLNPLVEHDGEWEAWHFGPRLGGARRFHSFAALLEADVEALEAATDVPDLDALAAEMRAGSDEERMQAAGRLLAHGRTEAIRVLRELARPECDARVGAVRCLTRSDDPAALAALEEIARDGGDDVREALIDRLAGAGGDVAEAILTDAPDWMISPVGPNGVDTLFAVYERTGDPRLVAQLALHGDPRAAAPLAALIVDPASSPQVRERLAEYAARPGDPSVVPALADAAAHQLATLPALAAALADLGAYDEAVAVLVRAVRQADPRGLRSRKLGWLRHPAALDALLPLFHEHPTPALASALGWYPEGVDALADAAHDPQLRVAAIDALEKLRATDRLAALDDPLAVRALARLRDPRARRPLLALLYDAEHALQGADGLRDLRDPTTAPALRAIEDAEGDDLRTVVAHALAML